MSTVCNNHPRFLAFLKSTVRSGWGEWISVIDSSQGATTFELLYENFIGHLLLGRIGRWRAGRWINLTWRWRSRLPTATRKDQDRVGYRQEVTSRPARTQQVSLSMKRGRWNLKSYFAQYHMNNCLLAVSLVKLKRCVWRLCLSLFYRVVFVFLRLKSLPIWKFGKQHNNGLLRSCI